MPELPGNYLVLLDSKISIVVSFLLQYNNLNFTHDIVLIDLYRIALFNFLIISHQIKKIYFVKFLKFLYQL